MRADSQTPAAPALHRRGQWRERGRRVCVCVCVCVCGHSGRDSDSMCVCGAGVFLCVCAARVDRASDRGLPCAGVLHVCVHCAVRGVCCAVVPMFGVRRSAWWLVMPVMSAAIVRRCHFFFDSTCAHGVPQRRCGDSGPFPCIPSRCCPRLFVGSCCRYDSLLPQKNLRTHQPSPMKVLFPRRDMLRLASHISCYISSVPW